MSNQVGTSIVEGLRYVRSIHRNVSRLLMSADALLSEHGLLPYDGWSASYPLNFRATAPDDWLAEYFIRQFYSRGKRNSEVLTVGVVLVPPERFSDVPVCLASSMAVRRVPNAVYTLSVAQVAARNHPPDGIVRAIRAADLETDWFGSSEITSFSELVVDDRLTSVAVPLTAVNSSAELESLLIKPLLGYFSSGSEAISSAGT
jgi:hypothetical protein